MELSRVAPALDFSRKVEGGIGIVPYNAALNALSALGWGSLCPKTADTRSIIKSLTGRPLHVCSFHDQLVLLFTSMPEKEGLQPDYDSYSAVIKSYLKEAVCGYRQFSPSHPASRARGEDGGCQSTSGPAIHSIITPLWPLSHC